jgi:DNA-directed RNA polymerase I, II, and III subunit RPABC2
MSRIFKKRKEYLEARKRIRIGSIFITRYEKARIIGARALQISFQASVLVDVPPGITDPIQIAEIELREKALPITIRRHLPGGDYQDIPVSWLIYE